MVPAFAGNFCEWNTLCIPCYSQVDHNICFVASVLNDQPSTGSYASIVAAVVSPLSRGNVTISSADTNVLPIISPNWLTHPADQALILAGYKRIRQVFGTPSLQKVVTGEEFFPGSQYSTDKELYEAITQSAMTVWHASGTCKMGKTNDPTAVIDTKGQVLGVQGLRVVDASSFPFLPPGHPQSVICKCLH